jgi:hypothetical protein
MQEKMGQHTGGLTGEDLKRLLSYIERARVSAPLRREELKALVQLKRAIRKMGGASVMDLDYFELDEPTPRQPAVPDIYGNFSQIPEDWQPSPRTMKWLEAEMGRQKMDYDIRWLVQEFVTFWRSRGKALANWQQAFRHSILQKLARGMSFGPGQQGNVGPGWPRTRTLRVFDRAAALREQRLADYDREAHDIVDGSGAGKADREPPPETD